MKMGLSLKAFAFTRPFCFGMKLNEIIKLKYDVPWLICLAFLFHTCSFIERTQAAYHVFSYGNEYQTRPVSDNHDTHNEKFNVDCAQIFHNDCNQIPYEIFCVEREPSVKLRLIFFLIHKVSLYRRVRIHRSMFTISEGAVQMHRCPHPQQNKRPGCPNIWVQLSKLASFLAGQML